MKFCDYISLRESALESVPLSRAGFKAGNIAHGEYEPKNFDRYPFRPDDAKVSRYADKMRSLIKNDMHICVEALAGYYGNDGIVKAFDDFLTDLSQQNIRL